MQKLNYKAFLIVFCVILLALVIGLWSWNTLAELFDWQQAQLKHAVAALALLLIARSILFPRWGWRHRRGKKCQPKHAENDAQQDTEKGDEEKGTG
jgi:hypothetical protein